MTEKTCDSIGRKPTFKTDSALNDLRQPDVDMRRRISLEQAKKSKVSIIEEKQRLKDWSEEEKQGFCPF